VVDDTLAIMFAVIEIYLERTFTLGRVESVSVLCQQSWGLHGKNVLQLVRVLLTRLTLRNPRLPLFYNVQGLPR